MIRVNSLDNMFHDKDNSNPGTLISSAWLNSIQEEIAGVLEGFGVEVNSSISNQLFIILAQKLDERALQDHTHASTNGTFQSSDGKTVTVENGIITSII